KRYPRAPVRMQRATFTHPEATLVFNGYTKGPYRHSPNYVRAMLALLDSPNYQDLQETNLTRCSRAHFGYPQPKRFLLLFTVISQEHTLTWKTPFGERGGCAVSL